MIKNVLVPIDFSDLTLNTVKKVFYFLSENGGTIHLVHALQTQLYYSDLFFNGEVLEIDSLELKKKVSVEMNNIVNSFSSSNISFKIHFEIGTIIENIEDCLEDNVIDLVVLGTEGKSGIEEFLLGSNTQRTIRFIDKSPVLVLKNNQQEISINKILIVSSFNDDDYFDFNRYLSLFDIHTSFDLLKVITPQHFESTENSNDKLDAFQERFSGDIRHKVVYNYFNIEDGIQSYLNRHPEIDMVVLPTHGRKGLSRFYHGSLTELVVNHLKSPVFTFKL
jgi:nucleotide-binding universal stress UspA family protein